jgi:D-aspartate ligase
VAECRGAAGVGWVRMTTDVPAAFCAVIAGDISLRAYLQSLRTCSADAVFSTEDPLPGLAEVMLVPYLAMKRGF